MGKLGIIHVHTCTCSHTCTSTHTCTCSQTCTYTPTAYTTRLTVTVTDIHTGNILFNTHPVSLSQHNFITLIFTRYLCLTPTPQAGTQNCKTHTCIVATTYCTCVLKSTIISGDQSCQCTRTDSVSAYLLRVT